MRDFIVAIIDLLFAVGEFAMNKIVKPIGVVVILGTIGFGCLFVIVYGIGTAVEWIINKKKAFSKRRSERKKRK